MRKYRVFQDVDNTQDCTPHRGIRIVARNVGDGRDEREVCGGGRDAAVVLSGVGGGGSARATVTTRDGRGTRGGAAMTRPRRRSKVETITSVAVHPATVAQPNRKPLRDLKRDTPVVNGTV